MTIKTVIPNGSAMDELLKDRRQTLSDIQDLKIALDDTEHKIKMALILDQNYLMLNVNWLRMTQVYKI